MRSDEDKYTLSDYVNEHSKLKVWYQTPSSKQDHQFEIKTINIFNEIFRTFPQFAPSPECLRNSKRLAEPHAWKILRNLFIDKMCLTTLKQQSDNPRNVVLVLKPSRANHESQVVEVRESGQSFDQLVYFVGRLDPDFENFEHL